MPKNVLAVDPNAATLRLYEDCFSGSNYRLTTKSIPIEAFNEIDARAKIIKTIDLLITALEVPSILSSSDLIRYSHAVSPQTRFMLCGGEEKSNRLISLLRNEGIEVGYLPPSYIGDKDRLLEEVKSLIGE